MRIVHTSDWHLGRTFHGRLLDEAHAAYADHLVELVREERVDAVLISGDVYDRAIPPTDSVRLLDDTLRRLTELTHVVLTPGNHDSARRLGFASELMRSRLSIRARLSEIGSAVEIPTSDGELGALVYPLPYLDPHVARIALVPALVERLGEEHADEAGELEPLPTTHEAVVSAALRLVASDLHSRRRAEPSRVPALVMAHAFVMGGAASEESERDIRVGGVDSVSAEAFLTLGGARPLPADADRGLDYVALGHLHRPQEIHLPESLREAAGEVTPPLVYSGSPVPFSFSEAAWPKSTVLLSVEGSGMHSMERIPAPLIHRVCTVEGTMEELMGPAHDDAVGAWVRAIVHGPMPVGAPAMLKERFGQVLAIQRVHEAVAVSPQVEITRSSDPLEVAGEFLAQAAGREPREEEAQVLRETYEALLRESRSA